MPRAKRWLADLKIKLVPGRRSLTLQEGISEVIGLFLCAHKMKLPRKCRQFYDANSDLWIDNWGDHMHHGFYPADTTSSSQRSMSDHRSAQEQMINNAIQWSFSSDIASTSRELDTTLEGILKTPGYRLVDVGCGVGGSSRYLASKYSMHGNGLSLSKRQVASV